MSNRAGASSTDTIDTPIIRVDQVAHVGTLDPSKKRSHSYEGNSLSASWCPDAWTAIAQLGGVDSSTWILHHAQGRFLDLARRPRAFSAHVRVWALKSGLLKLATFYRASWHDDDLGQDVFVDFPTRDEALAEYHECDIRRIRDVATTNRLHPYLGLEKAHGREAVDTAAIAWALVYGLDGVWWRERLDPSIYSAPRGCIFRTQLWRWKASLATESGLEEIDLDRFPKTLAETMTLDPHRLPYACDDCMNESASCDVFDGPACAGAPCGLGYLEGDHVL